VRQLTLSILLALLVACTRPDDAGWGERRAAQEKIELMRQFGRANDHASIAKFLQDANPWVVANACGDLGRLKAREYIPDLVVLLASPEPDVANLAGFGLSQMIDERDTAILPDLYRNLDRNELLVRMSAIEAIGKVRSAPSVDVLVKHLPQQEPAAQLSLYMALGDIGDPRALPVLRQALSDAQAMDHGIPNLGRSRGDPPHPDLLQGQIQDAIKRIQQAQT
jgi:HEAT repeat protein